MKKIIIIVLCILSAQTQAAQYFSTRLCESGQLDCIQIKKGDTWISLFPDENERDFVKRFNRVNTRLRTGTLIAIPDNLTNLDPMSIAPFEHKIDPPGTKMIVIDLTQLAFGAYDSDGNLIKWGPASGGRNWCQDINEPCKTVIGRFQIYDVRGEKCVSTKFPVDEGGAPMPYGMFFEGGYALHGSNEVPGYNASHGCVRLFKEDAKWLNEEFVRTPGRTKVLVLPYEE